MAWLTPELAAAVVALVTGLVGAVLGWLEKRRAEKAAKRMDERDVVDRGSDERMRREWRRAIREYRKRNGLSDSD